MKSINYKTAQRTKPSTRIAERTEPYEIIYADSRNDEIHLEFLKRARINAHMARWFLDYEYNQLIWSDGIFEILELDSRSAGASYTRFLEIVHPDDRYLKNKANEDLQKTKKPLEINYRLLFSDGRIKWINEICSTDFDQNSHPLRSYGTIQDITKYKISENNIRLKEEQFRNLIESIPSGIAIIRNNKFSFINKSGAKIFGADSPVELSGKPIIKFLPPESKREFLKKVKSVLLERQELTFEEKFIRLDNTEFEGEVCLAQTVLQDSPAIQLIINDITQRRKAEDDLRKSEEKFRTLAVNLSDVIWAMDLSGYITFVSPSIKRILGFDALEVTNQNISSFLTPESAALLFSKIADWKLKKRSHQSTISNKIILESVDKNRKTKLIEITSDPIYDTKNTLTGFTGICQDVTERIKAEQLLKDNEIKLKELIATKDKFFSIIAHELRSPFNSIIGFLELIQSQYEDFDDSEKKYYLQQTEENAINTLKLLDNLLEWAKTQSGKISFQPIQQDLLPIVKEVAETLNPSLKFKRLSLDYDIEDELKIYADKNMLTTIFQNLLSNAIKYSMPREKILIEAKQKGNFVEIIVTDSGTGMSEETKNKLFRIDEQISVPGTANEKGSGLGLLLCEDFIKRHNGSIEIESEPEKGSKFIFRIPK